MRRACGARSSGPAASRTLTCAGFPEEVDLRVGRRRSSRSRSRSTRAGTSIAAIPRCGRVRRSSRSSRWSRAISRRCAERLEAAAARLRAIPGFPGRPRGATLTGAPERGGRRHCGSATPPTILFGRSLPEWGQSPSPNASECHAVTVAAFADACARRGRPSAPFESGSSGTCRSRRREPSRPGANCSPCCSPADTGARRPSTTCSVEAREALGPGARRLDHAAASRRPGLVAGRTGGARGAAAHRRRLPSALRADLAALP